MTGLIRFSPLNARAFATAPRADFERAFDTLTAQCFGHGRVGTDATLRADVFETETAYTLRLDVPGVAKDSVNVSVEDKLVTIEVNFANAAVEGEKALRNERATGEAARSFRFPQALDAEAASATQEHGVLTLTLPKKAVTNSKRVTIN
jgi:HSP20 family protein